MVIRVSKLPKYKLEQKGENKHGNKNTFCPSLQMSCEMHNKDDSH
jgi:hypothetical protein